MMSFTKLFIKIIPSILVLLALTGMVEAAGSLRQDININRDWKFKLGDHPGGEVAAFDDAKWDAIHLPHSFSMPYFGSKDFYVGYGWYRKHLEIKPEWVSKRIFVEFEGAFQDAEIYVNGKRIGEHMGGFTGFSMDITDAVLPGGNLLAVRLNNNWNAQIEPLAGDHTFMGGIYRNVHLVVTDPLHVTWYGTFVTTRDVSGRSATVNVKTEIANQGVAAKECVLTTRIIDPDGKQVALLATTRRIEAGATVTLDQSSAAIPSPKLWHPAHPFLYTAVTTLSDGSTPLDDYKTTFGIRSIQWTADRGFFLNGEHHYFHGANVHQDHAGWGDAVSNSGAERDVKLVKEAGMDFIRGSHYPHHPAFAEACDKLGVLFWSENCFWAVGNFSESEGYWNADCYPSNPNDQAAFEQNALDTLRDEIRIFRNHPSVIVWSMCNEVFFTKQPDKVKGLLTKLVKETHELDPTRPAAIGGCQRGEIDKLGDVAGYNGDGSVMKEFQNPGIPSVVSEYGSHISDRGDAKSDLYDGMFSKETLESDTPEYPWRSGQSLWCAFDYSTILGHFGCMGFIDYFRIPKRSWYWYRNRYRHIPPPEWSQNGTPAKLSLTADKTTLHGTDATDDCQILVTVQDKNGKPISNSPPVTFTIESGPGEFPTGRSITFNPPSEDPNSDIAIRDGKAAIEFRTYQGGKSVIRATSPGLQDGMVSITTKGDPEFIPGKTPLVSERPYVRFVKSDPAGTAVRNASLNHPVRSSSETPGHEAKLVNDGNAGTGWKAAASTPGEWWQIDLESLNTITSVETTFDEGVNYQYKIEASPDGVNWTMLSDQTRATATDKVRTDSCAKNERNRFLRLTITGLPADKAALVGEVKIFATPSQ
jgi:hypothetical protein